MERWFPPRAENAELEIETVSADESGRSNATAGSARNPQQTPDRAAQVNGLVWVALQPNGDAHTRTSSQNAAKIPIRDQGGEPPRDPRP